MVKIRTLRAPLYAVLRVFIQFSAVRESLYSIRQTVRYPADYQCLHESYRFFFCIPVLPVFGRFTSWAKWLKAAYCHISQLCRGAPFIVCLAELTVETEPGEIAKKKTLWKFVCLDAIYMVSIVH